MSKPIISLHRANKSVFTTDDLRIIWDEADSEKLKNKIAYFTRSGQLKRLAKGVYALDDNYNRYELATSIYSPSYISFETVLRNEGLIFQHYQTIFSASYLSRELAVDDNQLTYRKIKNEVLVNTDGIIQHSGFAIASKERALLDTLYINPKFYCDNLSQVDWTTCMSLVGIYDNKSLVSRVEEMKQHA